jgi:hypothetical protein
LIIFNTRGSFTTNNNAALLKLTAAIQIGCFQIIYTDTLPLKLDFGKKEIKRLLNPQRDLYFVIIPYLCKITIIQRGLSSSDSFLKMRDE